ARLHQENADLSADDAVIATGTEAFPCRWVGKGQWRSNGKTLSTAADSQVLLPQMGLTVGTLAGGRKLLARVWPTRPATTDAADLRYRPKSLNSQINRDKPLPTQIGPVPPASGHINGLSRVSACTRNMDATRSSDDERYRPPICTKCLRVGLLLDIGRA